MARMSIDDMVERDTKFDRLAELCGWSRRETVGCMFEIWALCYDRVTPNIAPADLDIAAKRNAVSPAKHPNGFAAALVGSRLGRPATKDDRFYTKLLKDKTTLRIPWADQEWRDRVYVCGASDRIGYLLSSKEFGIQGGHKGAESRAKSRKGPSRGDGSDPDTDSLGVGNPSVPDPVPSSVVVKEDVARPTAGGALELESPGLRNLKAKVDRATAPVAGYHECIADFDARFTAANNGSRPTWDSATGKLLKTLLTKHGAAEVHKRIACLFEQPPSWLTGAVTFKTLVGQFDALIPRAQQLPTRTIPEL